MCTSISLAAYECVLKIHSLLVFDTICVLFCCSVLSVLGIKPSYSRSLTFAFDISKSTAAAAHATSMWMRMWTVGVAAEDNGDDDDDVLWQHL